MQIWRNVDQKLLAELLVVASRRYVDARVPGDREIVIERAGSACACGCESHRGPAPCPDRHRHRPA